MKFLKDKVEEIRPLFEEGGKYEKFYFLYEAQETLFFQPKHTAGIKGAHIRDANDMKRMMVTVIAALIPCLLFGMWNVGDQHFANIGAAAINEFLLENGALPGFMDRFIFGAIKTLPIIAVSYAVGLGIEFVFATIRRHPVAEGFLVSGMLIPLVCPPTIPLWQVGIATAFAVVLGKEVFGGTGMNLLNPALTARAFLFFSYSGQISGDEVWVAVDGFSGPTPLAMGANIMKNLGSTDVDNIAVLTNSQNLLDGLNFQDLFFGFIPGCIGETSALMCLIGAGLLIVTGVGSWRIMLSMLIGGAVMAYFLESVIDIHFFGSENWVYHLVTGGFAFGLVFMATDPVSAAHTTMGKYFYGFLAGLLAILIRVANPAYPEGVMLAILLMNVVAPTIDYMVVSSNKNRRLKRVKVG